MHTVHVRMCSPEDCSGLLSGGENQREDDEQEAEDVGQGLACHAHFWNVVVRVYDAMHLHIQVLHLEEKKRRVDS